MSLASAFSPGFWGPARHKKRRSEKQPMKAHVNHGPPVPVHAIFQLASGGINVVLEPDFSVFLSGKPILQPGGQVTQMTISGDHMGDTENRDLPVLRGEVAYSIPTLRSVTIRGTNGKDTSGIVDALLPSKWRVLPNLVALELSDIVDSSTGINPIRKIGEAIEVRDQLPALEELTLRDCSTLEIDVGPLAAGLRNGHARELRVLRCCNQHGNLGVVPSLLLEALAHGDSRPRVQVLSFADNWSFANTPLLHLKEALQACPRLRTLRIDCSLEPAPELRALATSINKRQQPALEYVYVRVPGVMSDHMPTRGSAEYLSRVAEIRKEPFRLEMELG